MDSSSTPKPLSTLGAIILWSFLIAFVLALVQFGKDGLKINPNPSPSVEVSNVPTTPAP